MDVSRVVKVEIDTAAQIGFKEEQLIVSVRRAH